MLPISLMDSERVNWLRTDDVLVHSNTRFTVKIHEREQSAHCREKDTGGRCGVTGDVGVGTSDSATYG